MSAPTLELTAFALRPGLRWPGFVATLPELDAFLARQPGSLGRILARDAEGRCLHMALWRDRAAALAGADAAWVDPEAFPFLRAAAAGRPRTRLFDLVQDAA